MTNLGRALEIHGWMSGPELQFLALCALGSKKILEVGSYKGRSTRALADNTDGIIHCIDPWDGKYQVYPSGIHYNGDDLTYSLFCANLGNHLINGKVVVHRKNFKDFVSNDKFDFIFLDAIHEYDALKEDISHARNLLTPGGIIAGHDYCAGWPGVIRIVDELFPDCGKVESIWYHIIT